VGTLSGADARSRNRSAAGERAAKAELVAEDVLVPGQVGHVLPDEVAGVVGRDERDLAGRVPGLADGHAERPEVPVRVRALVGQLHDGLVALDRVARDVVAGGLGARDGALQRVGAGGVGHVRELLGATAGVLEGRPVGAVALGPGALGVDVGERRDGVRVVDHRDRRGCQRVARLRRRRVLGGAYVRVPLSSLRGAARVALR